MEKTKITVATVGHMPADFNRNKIQKWKSSIFEIDDEIQSYSLPCDSDGQGWEFTDRQISTILPSDFNGNFFVAIVNVPIEQNWYSRRLSNNRIVISFYEMKDILGHSNIPLENLIFKILYAYTLLYKRNGNRIPEVVELAKFTHDETRGCIFDMNGIKSDAIYSCHNPIICSACVENLKREIVSVELIANCQKDIRKIKKLIYFRILDFIKCHPLLALLISGITAIIVGITGSVLGAFVWEALIK